MTAPSIRLLALSTCPVAGLVWSPAAGPSPAWRLTVVCRATLVLRPGRAVLAPRQHHPVDGDRGYPDGSSPDLYAPSDLVPEKPRAEVVVVGPARGPSARLAIGAIDKRVHASPGRPCALGPTRPTPLPASLHGRPLPASLDLRAAPADQTLEALRGDEPLTLEHLHPEHPQLVTQLPGLAPVALVDGPGLRASRLRMRADTLWIDAATGLAALVWRAELDLSRGVPRAVLVDVDLPTGTHALKSTAGISVDALRQAALPFLGAAPAAPAAPPVAPPPAPLAPPPLAPAPPASERSPWVQGMIGARAPAPLPLTPLVVPVREAAPATAPPSPRPATETLQLLGYDAPAVPRARRTAAFRALLDALDERRAEGDEPPPGADLADREDRRELFEILARGEPLDAAAVTRALDAAVAGDGRFTAPVVLVTGELSLRFDARRSLEAMVSAAAPFAAAEAVKAELAPARAFLEARGVGHGPAVTAHLAARLRAAVLTLPEAQRPPDLDAELERGLLDARALDRRRLHGAPHVRARLALPGAGAAPVYLPAAIADTLPRAARSRIRLLATVHPAIDAAEASPWALRAVAAAAVTARASG